MTDAQTTAIDYLSPTNDSPWRWTVDGEASAAAWIDGTTIAFLQEIHAIVEHLAPNGLPRFGSILFLLAACRDGWEQSSGRHHFEEFARACPHWIIDGQIKSSVDISPARTVLKQLDAVGRLRADLRHGIAAKRVLAETVFEPSAKQLRTEEAASVVTALADGINPAALAARFESEDSLSQFARDCEALQPGLGMVDAGALALRARTGLDEMILPADVDLSPAERVCRLLADLIHDKEFAGLARLAQKLIAAVHVPRYLHAPQELPVGGVSDLSNRGSLDRLLVSELANDSLTLAVRIALNEALYLRRESPPRDPPHRRAILLDCGIRLWGIPRAFAIASALAFAATTDRAAELAAFRAAGKEAEPLDLTTRDGLISCMAALDAWPHPGDSLQPFLDAVANSRAEPADAILITHPDVLADPAFSAALTAAAIDLLYVATVDGTGHFQMFAISPAGRKRVTEARLDLQTLFVGSAAPTRSLTATRHPSLPAIWNVEPFPLRLPCILEPRRAIASPDFGLLAVSRDGRLLHWESQAKHARQLSMTLPNQALLGLFYIATSHTAYAVFAHRRESRACFVWAELATGKTDAFELKLEGQPGMGCCVVGQSLCIISKDAVEAFSLTDGKRLATLSLGGKKVKWTRDRFFAEQADWYALAYDGQVLRLESVRFRTYPARGLAFDREQSEGPWLVDADGDIITTLTHDSVISSSSFRAASLLGVSFDGNRVAVRTTGEKTFGLDLTTDWVWKPIEYPWAEFLVGPQFDWTTPFPAMAPASYSGVYINENRELCLISAKDDEWQLTATAGGSCCLARRSQVTGRGAIKSFDGVPLDEGDHIQLFRTGWSDGSKIFYDSRRLLHLRSSDRTLPEVTIVLCSGELTAWSSDGRLFGQRAFLQDGQYASNAELAELVRRFVLRLR